MDAIKRRAWWYLVAFCGLLLVFGIGDVLIGPPYDPGITQGLTGLTLAQLEAESDAGYRLLDFYTRIGGVHLTVIGLALLAVLWIPYRAGQAWAWRTMWLLPGWTAFSFAVDMAFGVAPGQAPPPPFVSAPILGALAVAALILDRDRFAARRAVALREVAPA